MSLDRSTDLPLFPLPELVMFPGVRLPLHIFEPRYRAMLRDALRSRDPSFVLVRATGGDDAKGRAAVASVGCVARIAEHVPLSDGRANVLAVGVERVRISEIDTDTPYRMTRWEPLDDEQDKATSGDTNVLRHVVSSFCDDVRRIESDFDLSLPMDLEPERLSDLAAFHLVADSDMRQRILECTSPGERVRMTTDAILSQASMLRTDKSVLH